jgi:hypothetical protein
MIFSNPRTSQLETLIVKEVIPETPLLGITANMPFCICGPILIEKSLEPVIAPDLRETEKW